MDIAARHLRFANEEAAGPSPLYEVLGAVHKPRFIAGDLPGSTLERLCAEAPANVTRVMFHTAVLA